MRSSTVCGSSSGTLASAAWTIVAVRSSGRQSTSEPLLARPIGVRAVETMTASGMAPVYCATIPAVKFGLQLPIQAQSRIFAEEWEASAGPSELAAVARACEGAGFDYVAVCDHVAIPRSKAD